MSSDKGKSGKTERPVGGLTYEWLDAVHGEWVRVKHGRHSVAGGERVDLADFGALLAEAIGRGDPFSPSAVSAWLLGRLASEDLTLAICKLFSLAPPIASARTDEEARVFQLVQSVSDGDPTGVTLTLFLLELEARRAGLGDRAVNGLRQIQRRARELEEDIEKRIRETEAAGGE